MFKKIIISILKGLYDLIPIIPRIKDNINSDGLTKIGKVDYLRLLTSVSTLILLILFFLGKLDFAQLEKLLHYLE